MEADRDTPYQPLDDRSDLPGVRAAVNSTGSSSARQVNDNGSDRHKRLEASSSDGSPTPLMRGGSGSGSNSNRSHFDVSSESGGGSDGEGGLKTRRGPKKTISFWVSCFEVLYCTAVKQTIV